MNDVWDLNVIYRGFDDPAFADDLKKGMYISAFEKSVKLAEKRGVSEAEGVKNKTEIDAYFTGGKNNG